MKILIRSIFLVITFVGEFLLLGVHRTAAEVPPKTVLVLSPFQLDLSTSLIAAEAMREEFGKASDLNLDVYYEYLDINRFPESTQKQTFDLLTDKYKNKKVDLVIVSSETMLKLWMTQRVDILPKTPVVFFDVFTEHLDGLNLPAEVTGVSGVEDCEKSVLWLLKTRPFVNEIILVGGTGKIEQGFNDHIQRLQEKLHGQVKFSNLSGLSLGEIKERVIKLPRTSAILYHPMFEDSQGNKYHPLEALREMAEVSPVPIIGSYDQFIGTGIIGGYMYSIDQQARDAVEISLRFLRGESINSIPTAYNQSNRYIFDHLALQRFGIPLSLLPANSLVKNHQYSFWELYQPEIIATSIGIVILLLMVIFLLAQARQLNHTRLALATLNASLEIQVQERTTLLNLANIHLQDEIAKHVQSDMKLHESERRLFTLMGNLPGMAYRCRNDADWTMEFVSDGCVELTGYTADELINNRDAAYGQLIHEEDRDQVWNNVQAALLGGSLFDLVYRIISAPGIEKWVMERGRGIFSEQGELVALEGFITDITQQMHMERALRESEILNKGILNSLTAHIAVLDADGVIISVNEPWRNFARANGVHDLVGTVEKVNYLEVLRRAEQVSPEEIAPVRQGIEEVLKRTRPYFQTEYPCDSSTEKRWFRMMVVPLSSRDGGVVITHENITARKMDERALQESKSSLQSVLQSTADGILAIDPTGRVLFANDRLKNMWGIPAIIFDNNDYSSFLHHVHAQVNNPQEFIQEIEEFNLSDNERFKTLNFKDGRVFECFSRPLLLDEKAGGRVWSFRDVTAQKLAEEQLHESEEKYRVLLDSQEGSIMIFDYDGIYHYANRASVDSLSTIGFKHEVIGKRLHDLYPQSTANWQLGQIRQVFATGKGFADDFEDVLDNQHSWWHLNFQPIRNAAGHVVQVMVNALNITERKSMEVALRESEARTATILRLSPIVIGVSTVSEGRYTDVNEAFEHVLGYSPDEVIDKTSFELNLWADENARERILDEIQANGRVENLEIRLRRKSGEIFPALVFITPIYLHDTPCLLTMFMDITERKYVEEQLRETRDALQAIIHSSPLAILTLDTEDRIVMWNPAAEAMFGWSDKQILGQLNPTVPENKVKEYKALRLATLSGMAFSNLDTMRVRKDGTLFPVSLSVAPLRGEQMQVVGRLHILMDITERKKLQEELRQQATTDELTKISNRRHFLELAKTEIKRAVRLKRLPAIALIDLDHFKQINDRFGHTIGDQALIRFTQISLGFIREIDVFARFGGDEFIMLFPETNQDQAYQVLERIRVALAQHPQDLNGVEVSMTISVGITSLTEKIETFDLLLSQADGALYRAKELGRNTIVRFKQL